MRLPFPDVQAIGGFVEEVLAGGDSDSDSGEGGGSGGGRLTPEERRRNHFSAAKLMMSLLHPLASRLLGVQAAPPAAGAPPLADGEEGGEGQAGTAGASVLSLVTGRGGGGAACGAASDQHAVLCVPADIAGQDVPPFSPTLLPGERRCAVRCGAVRCGCCARLLAGMTGAPSAHSQGRPPRSACHNRVQALWRGSAR